MERLSWSETNWEESPLYMSITQILIRIAAIIFFVEGVIMAGLLFFDDLPLHATVLIDGVLLVALSSPLMFALVLKPYVKARTEEIERARLFAEQANRAKDEFLAHMSHELRTPLNAVIGFGQLLQYNPAEPLSDTQTEYANSIVFSGEHLLEIINGMLDLASIEAGHMTITLEDVHTQDLFDECLSLLQPMATKREVKLESVSSTNAHALIRADQVRLKQALLNLLSNAIKYNKTGGKVALRGCLTDDGRYKIFVEDTGFGIAPEHFDSIFKPFDRLGVETTKPIEGTGIGLTVTKKLIEAMQGRIGFESKLGEGSVFWLELPLAAPLTELQWQESMSTGVASVDDDHRVLIGLVNKMSDHALGQGEIDGVLDEILSYTLYHFEREEAVMQACGYPGFDSHRTAHKKLAAKAVHLAQEWQRNHRMGVVHELRLFLRAWLVKHIMEEDRAFKPYAETAMDRIEDALVELEERNAREDADAEREQSGTLSVQQVG